ncbi:hypothetical protein E4U10_002297 [Claviceps purpurea]|nr:hypothetical protein E4U10_002297 [Claviceps purpurea]
MNMSRPSTDGFGSRPKFFRKTATIDDSPLTVGTKTLRAFKASVASIKMGESFTMTGPAHPPSINRPVPIVNTLRQDTGYRPTVQPFYDPDASDWDQGNLEYGELQRYDRYENQDLFDHAQEMRDDI